VINISTKERKSLLTLSTFFRTTHTTLKVFNIVGKEVATLVNGYKTAGYHQVTFDGSKLPSGIYFYQFKVYPVVVGAGSPKGQAFIQTKKAILMK
ncbi:MAG: T9SS type A sorting domain-containing protein, partial [Bacteroidetes bacterium]|nr:T9SS type A sorting domain-containing protein [Bacteroidota bacterium]